MNDYKIILIKDLPKELVRHIQSCISDIYKVNPNKDTSGAFVLDEVYKISGIKKSLYIEFHLETIVKNKIGCDIGCWEYNFGEMPDYILDRFNNLKSKLKDITIS